MDQDQNQKSTTTVSPQSSGEGNKTKAVSAAVQGNVSLKEEQIQPDFQRPSVDKTTGKTAGRILLIEDDTPMAKMYATKLQLEGLEVSIAYDGEEGLRMTKEFSPDLVVLDLMIPKIGGMDLLQQLRNDVKTKNLPVIILSNLSQEQDIQKASQLGVKEYLIKANFTPGQVVEKIKAALAH